MNLDWAILAASALPSATSPPSALGIGVDTFFSQAPSLATISGGFPANAVGGAVPFAIVAKLLYSRAEVGRPLSFEIQVRAQDGAEVAKIQANVIGGLNRDLPTGWDQPLFVVLPINIIPTYFGPYSVEIFLNGGLQKSIPFRIRQTPVVPRSPSSP